MKIKKVNYFMSGGNNFLYYGELENGQFFSLGLNQLYILDTDYAETLTEQFDDLAAWEEEHIKKSFVLPTNNKKIIDLVNNIFMMLQETFKNVEEWEILKNRELNK